MLQIILDFGRVHLLGGQFPLRIFGYGLMLVLGFLLSMALAKWRARRMGENPDALTYVCLLALLCGVLGARIAYVIQDWDKFSREGNPLAAMLDITSGGLIYYGGLGLAMLAAIVYLAIKRLPLRRYLDILAPSIMLGLAFGRMGCLLNGCCYGGLCADTAPLSMHFPMYSKPLIKLDGRSNPYSQGTDAPSPVYGDQYDHKDANGQPEPLVHPPEQLVMQIGPAAGRLHAPRYFHGALKNDQLSVVMGTEQNAKALWLKVAPLDRMNEAQWQEALESAQGPLLGSEFWDEAVWFSTSNPPTPSGASTLDFDAFWRYCQARRIWLMGKFHTGAGETLLPAEAKAANEYLQADMISMAEAQHSLAVRPSQALSIAGAGLLALLLVLFTRLRKREGQVFALLMLAYPVLRFFEELIRADNPHNLSWHWSQLILTHNQYTSMVMFVIGMVILLALTRLPPSCGPAWAQRFGVGAGEPRKDRPTTRRSSQ
jgi:prolipoprotein diacylglyceryl transferase